VAVLEECQRDARFPHPPPGYSILSTEIIDACMVVTCKCLLPSNDVGRYYLADAGYKLEAGYMTPFRDTRYHKEEFRGVDMSTLWRKEKFNRIHSDLRNIVECRFEILKERWHILHKVPFFRREKQAQTIISCFALDNYLWLRTHDVPPSYPPLEWVDVNHETHIQEVREWITMMAWGLPLSNRR
jgi:hypothetical protein